MFEAFGERTLAVYGFLVFLYLQVAVIVLRAWPAERGLILLFALAAMLLLGPGYAYNTPVAWLCGATAVALVWLLAGHLRVGAVLRSVGLSATASAFGIAWIIGAPVQARPNLEVFGRLPPWGGGEIQALEAIAIAEWIGARLFLAAVVLAGIGRSVGTITHVIVEPLLPTPGRPRLLSTRVEWSVRHRAATSLVDRIRNVLIQIAWMITVICLKIALVSLNQLRAVLYIVLRVSVALINALWQAVVYVGRVINAIVRHTIVVTVEAVSGVVVAYEFALVVLVVPLSRSSPPAVGGK
jgi:hypothetical protein